MGRGRGKRKGERMGRGGGSANHRALPKKNLKRVMVRDGICGQSAREKMAVAVSNTFYVIFYPILAPIPNFIQIGRKIQKLKNFNNLSVLVGWATRTKNGHRH